MSPQTKHLDSTTITELTASGVGSATLRRWTLRARRRLHLTGRIAVTIVPPTISRKLNKQYRRRDRPTNVLSFDYRHEKIQADYPLEGEVLLCPAVIRREARTYEQTYRHRLRLLLEHGLIHLLGLDHASAAEQQRWERYEQQLL